MWSRHEPGDSSSERGSLEVEEIERKDKPKRRVKKQFILLLLILFINIIWFRCDKKR